VMGAATAMLVLALAWPLSERYVIAFITHGRIH
jgi:hypothetical protein